MAHVCVSAGLSLTCTATLLSILALVLNYWEKTIRTNGGIYIRFEIRRGLWEICYKTEFLNKFYSDENVCFYDEPNTDTFDGRVLILVRAFLILAVLALVGSAICTLLKLCMMTEKYQLMNIAWILAFTGGALILCGFSAYMNIRQIFKDYMFAFYLTVIAWGMSWAGGVFIFAASRKKGCVRRAATQT